MRDLGSLDEIIGSNLIDTIIQQTKYIKITKWVILATQSLLLGEIQVSPTKLYRSIFYLAGPIPRVVGLTGIPLIIKCVKSKEYFAISSHT